jgi:tyrosyl-tRNA synthetase
VGAAESKGDARKLLAGGGVTLNGKRVAGGAETLREVGALHGRFWLIRKGKRSYFAGRQAGSTGS